MQRRSFKNTLTFPDRLVKEAERFREEAETKPSGQERDNLLRKARQAETVPVSAPPDHPPHSARGCHTAAPACTLNEGGVPMRNISVVLACIASKILPI